MPRILTQDVVNFYLAPYFKVSSPVFGLEMGQRFKTARMKMQMTQVEMAKRLGLTQTDICRLETGKLERVSLTTQEFKTALGEHFGYVIVGSLHWKYEEIKWKKNNRFGMMVGSR